jgi:hypothetical protein
MYVCRSPIAAASFPPKGSTRQTDAPVAHPDKGCSLCKLSNPSSHWMLLLMAEPEHIFSILSTGCLSIQFSVLFLYKINSKKFVSLAHPTTR